MIEIRSRIQIILCSTVFIHNLRRSFLKVTKVQIQNISKIYKFI